MLQSSNIAKQAVDNHHSSDTFWQCTCGATALGVWSPTPVESFSLRGSLTRKAGPAPVEERSVKVNVRVCQNHATSGSASHMRPVASYYDGIRDTLIAVLRCM